MANQAELPDLLAAFNEQIWKWEFLIDLVDIDLTHLNSDVKDLTRGLEEVRRRLNELQQFRESQKETEAIKDMEILKEDREDRYELVPYLAEQPDCPEVEISPVGNCIE
ncbi:hypothetical protein CRG98_010570 [Punica granatum]|uniref:Uncharacterized protein n=1 Tax=Punica granatum TaxID=22663 RepID=A0A2I0KKR7_PUNGR|nr:hypothetical protein CRG98_010570 [Punica granatum]